ANGDGITRIVFFPDGKSFATAGSETAIRIWDVETGKNRAIWRGHGGTVKGLSVSPDGSRVASSDDNANVRIWDLASGANRELRGHSKAVPWVAFSPDGKTVVSASLDGTARLWLDDLPSDPAELRAWLEAAAADTTDLYGRGGKTAPR